VLELNHPTITGLHVCDVSFTVSGKVDDLLPVSGKLVFQAGAIPFHSPPRIAKATPFVSQCQSRTSPHLAIIGLPRRTLAGKIGLSLLALS